MNKTRCLIQLLTFSALVAGAVGTANAGIFVRSRVVIAPVVAPVVAAPAVVAAPVVAAPAVVAAPVAVAPVVAAPVVAAPIVVVPACRFVSVPVVNAFTGVTYLATRRVCN
jgi:hypothetical protein